MGVRGPLPDPQRQKRVGNSAQLIPKAEEVSAREVSTLPVEPPEGLGVTGRAVWAALCAIEWAKPSDAIALERLAQHEDERTMLRASLIQHGAMLTKPVITPKGEVVGTEVYANPALRELRRLDTQIMELLKGFGLTPMARARLGLAVIDAKKNSTVTAMIMASYRRAAEGHPSEVIDIAADD